MAIADEMLAAEATASPLDGPRPRPWMLRPPGLLFYAAMAVAVVVALGANSIQSFSGLVTTIVLWFALAGVWAARLVGATMATRLRFGLAEWVRWLAVPVILGAVYLLTRTTVPFDVRLSLSRTAMDQAAVEVIAGGDTTRGWIGLYPVERVERIPHGMRFVVTGAGFIDHWGFAYSTDGAPPDVDGNDEYDALDGNWWIWTDRF